MGCKIAHRWTLGMGREEDWGSHQIEHELPRNMMFPRRGACGCFFRRGLNMFTGSPRNGLSSSRCASFDVEYDVNDPIDGFTGNQTVYELLKTISMPTSLRIWASPINRCSTSLHTVARKRTADRWGILRCLMKRISAMCLN